MPLDVRVIGDTITADGDVVALLNREPINPTLQDQFETQLGSQVLSVDVQAILADLKDDLLKHKQAGWVRVSVIEEVLCNWSERYE